MIRRALLFDPEECIGCFACEVACKQEHQLPTGVNRIRILKKGPYRVGGKLKMDFSAARCRHCGKAACADACPVNAILKRPDGIVLFDAEVCIGCRACIEACPFKAPQYHPEKDAVEACDLCAERIDQGLEPSCVRHCPTRALVLEKLTGLWSAGPVLK